jgi:hypothetical protein
MPRRARNKVSNTTDNKHQISGVTKSTNVFSALATMDSDLESSDNESETFNEVSSDNNHKELDSDNESHHVESEKEEEVVESVVEKVVSVVKVREDTKDEYLNETNEADEYIAPSGSQWKSVSYSGKRKYKNRRERGDKFDREKKPPMEKVNKKVYSKKEEETMRSELGDDKLLNTKWKVWFHHNDDENWHEESCKLGYEIGSLGSFWRFFNNFHLLDKINNNVIIMRDGIVPIWEDVNNKDGGICSIKIDYYNKSGRNEIGSEIMICLCTLIMNESFVGNSKCINGIQYYIRNKSIMIKLWIKNFAENSKFTGKLPIELLHRIDQELKSYDTNRNFRGRYSSRISIQYKHIVPEYEI